MEQETSTEATIERLKREHRELDEAIKNLETKPSHSVGDEIEIKRLKKLKLQKKDAIHALVTRETA